jgi:5-(carboxyamino)imidazole ribonucleotide mutase
MSPPITAGEGFHLALNSWREAALTSASKVYQNLKERGAEDGYNLLRNRTGLEGFMARPLVGIILGSKSDLEVMQGAAEQLEAFGVPFELIVASAHRNPARVHSWAAGAAEAGIRVIIAAAGKAAHLAGVVAAFTPLPVIAVPMKTSDLGGLDSLLSMVQMPTGVPVATVAINGAKNAAILATQILGVADEGYRKKIEDYKKELAE